MQISDHADPIHAEIIEKLTAHGRLDLAERIRRCLAARLRRQHGADWPWRCRSPGCPRCLSRSMRRWTAGITAWAEAYRSAEVSTLCLPLLSADPTEAARCLRRQFRDFRDRAARIDARWRDVAVAGMVSDSEAVVVGAHPNLPPEGIACAMRRRWPEASMTSGMTPGAMHSISIGASTHVALALRRRGIEPIRIIIAAQHACAPAVRASRVVLDDPWSSPMPCIF
jgi:hypothetical protein